jgi:hypothetical protein
MGKDPVYHCELYKYDGCSHVDGFLCRIETCKERLEFVEDLKKNSEEQNVEGDTECPNHYHSTTITDWVT